jgi:exopolyphosphatase/pppGpp-phosphohydrolase
MAVYFLVLLMGIITTLSAQDSMRAAIDFGSGAIKIQMAVVKENRLHPLLTKYTSIGLVEDVATHEGRISDEKSQLALKILHGFKEEALQIAAREGYPSVQFTGIATAVFRKAENGNELLQLFEKQLGIPFQILPQDEEGKLGFLTAQALYQDPSLLAWDSGNGSFQMTIKEGENYAVYQGPLGHGTVRVLLSQEIRKGPVLQSHESANPVSREEAIELMHKIDGLLPATPDWLREKLKEENTLIATFGDGESIFYLVAQALAAQKEPVQLITLSDVHKVIEAYLGQNDAVFQGANLHLKTLTSAIHLFALMQHFGIEKIHYRRSLGITPGMLIAPQLWDDEKESVLYNDPLCAS